MEIRLTHKIWQDPIYFLAFGFGSGLAPVAPGTCGTLAAVPVYLLLANSTPWIYLLIVVLAFLFGIYLCHTVSNQLGVHDYPGIVWDEIVGYLLTMFMVPFELPWMLAGFILFRIFDIWKPFPIRWLDKHVTGGLGIMLDDVCAAIPAWFILQAVIFILIRQ